MQFFVKIMCIPLAALAAPANASNFKSWFEYQGVDLKRSDKSDAYCFVINEKRVDADGAPNAYHPEDVGPRKKSKPFLGLDAPEHAGYPGSKYWRDILVQDPTNASRPYVQKDGPYAGYFVATTWLTYPAIAKTDARAYVDASKISYLTFPNGLFFKTVGTGDKGDLGVAWNLGSGRKVAFVVADMGPVNAPLGEASVAFFEALSGTKVNARNNSGVTNDPIRILLFPKSHETYRWPLTGAQIEQHAFELLASVGGEKELTSCDQ